MWHLILAKLLVQNRDFVFHSKSRWVPQEGDFRCVPCVVNDKPSLICTVKNNVMNVTRYASQGFSSFSLNKSNSIAYICSVYEYGPLQNYIISKFLRKHVLYFQNILQLTLGKSSAEMRQSNYLSFNVIIKKVIHDTLFKACTFYFHAKWLFS